MNASNPEPVRGLSDASAELIETYFARVHSALLVSAAEECEEAVEDLREHIYEELSGTSGTPVDIARVLGELGTPEALAAECSAAATGGPRPIPAVRDGRSPLAGTLLGMPYELRFPTPERVAQRWWDPIEPKVLVPRVFGLGWDVNFGAVAVRLGLIRPDDEDVPFGSVPERWLALSAVIPVLVAVVFVALVALYQAALPPQVAVHWGITGAPDRFGSKESALVIPVVMTLLGLGVLGAAWLRRRPPLSRVAAAALAMMLCSISAASYGQQIATAYGPGDTGVLLPGMVAGLLLTFVMLVGLARMGRAVEMRRDLEGTSKKGSV